MTMASRTRKTPSTRKATKSRKGTKGRTAGKRWSQAVTEGSNALDLKKGVFTRKDPKTIALSLKRSAEHSKRRKSDPYRSAMSMLTFYINRAGKGLSQADRTRLEKAKDELRKAFGKTAA
jgi:Protein of unknown function (DUF3175)